MISVSTLKRMELRFYTGLAVPPRIMCGMWEAAYIVTCMRSNDTVALTDSSWELSQHSLSSERLWFTVQAIGQLHFTLLNRTYINHIVEELSLLTLSLYVPAKLWPKRSIRPTDEWLFQPVANQWPSSQGTSCSEQWWQRYHYPHWFL